MKRFSKLIVTLLVLAMAIGIFAAMPVAAAEYDALRLKTSMLTVGHYDTKAMDGDIVQHSANTNYDKEISCLIDNSNSNAYWSKPYKFSELVDNGGSTVPVIYIDLSSFNDGNGVAVSAFDMRQRSALDCGILHVVLQATLSANSNEWVTVADEKITVEQWATNPKQRVEFEEVTAFKFRILAYDIAEADSAADVYKDYVVVKGDETRFTLSEIDLLQAKEGSSGDSANGGSNGSSNGGSTTTTRPVIQFPTSGGSQGATQAPTQAPTKAPTQPATQAPTSGGNQSATKAPTQPATQAPTQIATQAPTSDVIATEPTGTVDPSAPTVDPSAPTVEPAVDPSAPTDEPTAAPTEGEPTAEPTVAVTEPESTSVSNVGGAEAPKDFTWLIIVAIVVAALVAGGVVYFIIKKKKQG